MIFGKSNGGCVRTVMFLVSRPLESTFLGLFELETESVCWSRLASVNCVHGHTENLPLPAPMFAFISGRIRDEFKRPLNTPVLFTLYFVQDCLKSSEHGVLYYTCRWKECEHMQTSTDL